MLHRSHPAATDADAAGSLKATLKFGEEAAQSLFLNQNPPCGFQWSAPMLHRSHPAATDADAAGSLVLKFEGAVAPNLPSKVFAPLQNAQTPKGGQQVSHHFHVACPASRRHSAWMRLGRQSVFQLFRRP